MPATIWYLLGVLIGRAESGRLETSREPQITAGHVAILRERLGMADAHNLELNRRLEESHATVDRMTLTLPAAGEGSGPRCSVWRFRER